MCNINQNVLINRHDVKILCCDFVERMKSKEMAYTGALMCVNCKIQNCSCTRGDRCLWVYLRQSPPPQCSFLEFACTVTHLFIDCTRIPTQQKKLCQMPHLLHRSHLCMYIYYIPKYYTYYQLFDNRKWFPFHKISCFHIIKLIKFE